QTLYERHRNPVFKYQLKLTGDPALAEDLLQETFLRVYEHLDRFDATRPFRPWLYQIARNTALNALRARRKKESGTGALPDRAGSDRLHAQTEASEAHGRIRAALTALDDEERALLVERVGLEMKLAEIADSLGCTERTVRN